MKIIQRCFTLVFLVALLVSKPISAQNNNKTPEQTYQVKDINPGPGSSDPGGLVELNGKYYFSAVGPSGKEMYYTDGTEVGTQLLKDIAPGLQGSVSDYRVLNGKLYISAHDGVHGFELWQSDGTEAGTHLLIDIYSGDYGSLPEYLWVANGYLFFLANDGTGVYLFRTDGTQAGTVKMTNDPNFYFKLCNFPRIELAGKFYFAAGYKGECLLFRTDGTPGNIEQVGSQEANALYFYNPSQLMVADNRLFFFAESYSYSPSYNGLWTINSNTGKAQFVKNVGMDVYLANFQNLLYFAGNDGTGSKLWRSDGTTLGTQVVPSAQGQPDYSDLSGGISPYSKGLIFGAYTSQYENELFKSDGQQVEMVKDISTITCFDRQYRCGSWPSGFTEIYGQVLFSANDKYGSVNDTELWITAGTADGTRLVADICPGDCGSEPRDFIRIGSKVYFTADDGQSGRELWAYEHSLNWTFLPVISH